VGCSEPEHRSHRQYTTGRPWLDVILIWSAIVFCIAAVIIFIRIGLPFILLFRLQWLLVVALFVLIGISIAWTSRQI
jgi:hypothetical protein